MSKKIDNIKIFSGNANLQLAEEISEYIKLPLSKILVSRFSDGETQVKIKENVRGADAYVIQSSSPPVNEYLMELLIIIDALRRASARRITAVIPYYGYARQDRKVQPRVPISAKLVANLITIAGVSRILTMDLHVGQIQGFFDIPVDHLYALPVMIEYFNQKEIENLAIVAPDTGALELARAFAKRLDATIAIIDKRREEANRSEVLNIIGDVKDKNLIIVDDLIDTGGTMINATIALKEKGAKNIYACCTHPILSGQAVERINNSLFTEVVVTNTIPFSLQSDKIRVLSVAELFGEAIIRIHTESSISSLFE